MPNDYGSLSAGLYTNSDVMAELDRAGPYARRSQAVAAYAGPAEQQPGYSSYEAQAAASALFNALDRDHDGNISRAEFDQFQKQASVFGTQVAGATQCAGACAAPAQYVGTTYGGQQVVGGSMQFSPGAVQYAAGGQPAVGSMRYMGATYGTTQVAGAAAPSAAQYAAQYATQYAAQPAAQQAQAYGNADPYGPGGIFEGAVDVYDKGTRHVVQESMVDARQQIISGVRPVYMFEKVVEVPQVVVKEYEREVIKPQLIERIIEVPKTEVVEREVVGPPTVQVKEQIVEIPEVHIEERVIHVPRREIQERLIEIPKVEYVERIEYDDYIEYREVVVDKIVEVPEIEYHIREVEHLVPQTYVQEYYIDRYGEVPLTQAQEVQRREEVGYGSGPGTFEAANQYMHSQAEAMRQMAGGARAYDSVLYGAPMEGALYSEGGAQQYAGPSYGDYDPSVPGGAGLSGYGYGPQYGSGGYGADGYNAFAGANVMSEVAKEQVQASIASMPIGSTVAVPKGTIRQGGYGSMSLPPGTTPPGTLVPGTMPPGTMPAGSMPPGSMPPGSVMPGSMPPGSMPPGSMPPGSMPPGSMQAMPGYPGMPPPTAASMRYGSMPPYAPDAMPYYADSGPPDYGPFASRPPVPVY
mmetsp:Transcript_165802/g.402955  ORF Transcript_165802/g.402955 Transcript_165802/m.402955 type:complete len:637 (-) Transcript_165802:50-1960(-)